MSLPRPISTNLGEMGFVFGSELGTNTGRWTPSPKNALKMLTELGHLSGKRPSAPLEGFPRSPDSPWSETICSSAVSRSRISPRVAVRKRKKTPTVLRVATKRLTVPRTQTRGIKPELRPKSRGSLPEHTSRSSRSRFQLPPEALSPRSLVPSPLRKETRSGCLSPKPNPVHQEGATPTRIYPNTVDVGGCPLF